MQRWRRRTTRVPEGRPAPGRSASLATALLALLLGPETGIAQEGGTGEPPEPALRAVLDRVEVVGSRIRGVDRETWKPVLAIERIDLERSGMLSVGEILQSLTVHGAALNPAVNNGGDGSTRVDLRNLGEQRTLVLVDGRRWITGIDGAVDLGSIPLALVERIEILKAGASAVYGSDAVAGVVSVTTRREVRGRQARLQLGAFGQGDGESAAVELASGWTAAGWDGNVSLVHQRQEPVYARDREISSRPVAGLPANDVFAGASPASPFGLFGFGLRGVCPFDPAGNYPANGLCASPDGRPPPFNRTTYAPEIDGYRLFDPRRDGYNFALENYLLTPHERSAAFLGARRRFGETLAADLQVLVNGRRSAQELAPSPIMLGAALPGASNLTIPADHVHNPFGQPVTGLVLRPGGALRRFEQDARTYHLAGGLSGILQPGNRLFGWRLDAVLSRRTLDVDSEGLLDAGRLRLALGPSFRDGAGIARCGTPAATVPGCVPLDPFRGPQGLTPEMLDYLYYGGSDRSRTDTRQLRLHLDGDLLELPAGALGFALGYEYRRDSGRSRLDPRRVALQGIVDTSFGGRLAAHESYLELSAPVLAGARQEAQLEASLALRHSRYDAFGSTSELEAGLRWTPTERLMLRASHAGGFRAPIVSELFFPAGEGIAGLVDDPCNAVNRPGPTQRANCAADGVPGGEYVPSGVLFTVLDGGNPALQPENARSYGLGMVWSPVWSPGLDIALDWYRLRIDDAIARPGHLDLLRFCADAGVPEACARTRRDASGELLAVDARLLNSGRLEVEGWDLGVKHLSDTRAGRVTLAWDLAYGVRHRFEVPRGSGIRSNLSVLRPWEPGFRLRSNLQLGWQRQAWSVVAIARYFSGLKEACVSPVQSGRPDLCSDPDTPSPVVPGFPVNRLGSATYLDLQVGWDSPGAGRIVLGVRNVLDRDPPRSYSAFANSFDPAYPLPARQAYLRLIQHW